MEITEQHSILDEKTIIMKKKNSMFVMTMIAIAALSFIKANRSEKLSDIALANIEALTNNEFVDGYYCYGIGKVVCPYSGELCAGYYQRLNVE